MTMHASTVDVTLDQQENFRFLIGFGASVPALIADEPPPLGVSAGPSPVQLLAAAVGNCLCDSLLFAGRKFHQNLEPLRGEVACHLGRDPEGKMRVQSMDVRLVMGTPASGIRHLERIVGSFEAFCTVTQSVRQAIPVKVTVMDGQGNTVKPV